jgi:uncharacterized protein YyaL (SSP411 family)
MNRLSKETSPYLLQHANNPVDWYPWGEEAFKKAIQEDKPILVSIGYSTCHWCHVMEHESFENEEVAKFMNEYFVNIKVDREERPDVDAIYMEVVQAISGGGGWPLNCFLLPDGRAFFAGTYFPPRPAHGRVSWMQVLNNIRTAFYNRRNEVENQAEALMDAIRKSDSAFISSISATATDNPFTRELLEKTFATLQPRFDREEGGFGSAPKFPSMMALRYCLQYHHFFKNKESLEHLNLSLRKMIFGGIYDQIGGGFARYTVDAAWQVPHFEKMLYDNGLLLRLLADGYACTRSLLYRETISKTVSWLQREMLSPEGGFFSAIDADSEGVEGKYYVWDKSEIDTLLRDKADLFNAFYGVTQHGNWEGVNILHRHSDYADFAKENGVEINYLKHVLSDCRELLLQARLKRIAPSSDTKILLDWNAILITGLCKANRTTANNEYLNLATKAAFFIETKMTELGTAKLYHTYKDGVAKQDAFLDDYAFWIEALVHLYFSTFNVHYLKQAERYTDVVLRNFLDTNDHLFFFTSAQQAQSLVLRKKDLYDNATPSGNAVMVHNLQRLGALLDRWDYREQAQKSLQAMLASIQKYPQSFAHWANALYWECCPTHEVAIVGKDYQQALAEINKCFFPNAVVAASIEPEKSGVPFLNGRKGGEETWIYVCQQGACQLPVQTVEEMMEQLEV